MPSGNGLATTQKSPRRGERRTNEERTAEMRSALIEAVIDSLCEVGYGKTTVYEICKRAGTTTGSMQHHFGSKEDLMVAALDLLRTEIRDRLESFTSDQSSVEEKCRSIVMELWQTFYGPKRYLAVWEIGMGSRSEPGLRRKVLQHRKDTLKMCSDIWKRTFHLTDDDEEKIASMHFTLSFLRGSVLHNAVSPEDKIFAMQLDILTRSLTTLMSN
jgi:AcrR family transcriptional regulator